LAAVNNDDNPYSMSLPAEGGSTFLGLLSGKEFPVQNGQISITLEPNSGDIYVPSDGKEPSAWKEVEVSTPSAAPVKEDFREVQEAPDSWMEVEEPIKAATTNNSWAEVSEDGTDIPCEEPAAKPEENGSKNEPEPAPTPAPSAQGSYEDGVIKGLQEAVLARMEKNGPITDQMRRDVEANVYHDSLINWIKSF
jgi:hypothetical protein